MRSSVTVMSQEIRQQNDKTICRYGYNKCLKLAVKYIWNSLKKNGDKPVLVNNTSTRCLPRFEVQKVLDPLKTTLYFSCRDLPTITSFGFQEAIIRLCKKNVKNTTASGVYQLNRPDCGNKHAGHTAGIMRKMQITFILL